MFKPTALISLLLTLLLTACGGDSGGSVVGGTNTDSGSDGTTDTVDNGDGTTSDVTTGTNITNPRLGNGTGASFAVGVLDISDTALSAGGTTNISATIVDADRSNAKIVSQQYGVEFSSTCSEADPAKASFSRDESVTSSGEVSVTYEAKGCSGTDIISFKLYASTDGTVDKTKVLHSATGTITVQPPEVGAITYVGTSAPAISISTIGDPVLPKLSSVTFRVLDRTNNPIGGKSVSFELTNSTGGVNLALSSGITDENGDVKAIVRAGTTHTVTSVRAVALANDGVTNIITSSQPISVTTGIADQDSFAIAADILNPGAFNVSGVEVNVTAYAADQFQNPVPDGTIINFTAESGIIGSSCPTTKGSCSVKWSSSGVRPGQHDAALQRVNEIDQQLATTVLGMTTILAYTQGESGFTDSNNNGLFDADEPFVTFPEAFRDDNWSSVVDMGTNARPVEFFSDFNNNGTYDAAPTTYQGVMCTDAAKGVGHCGSLMNVRSSLRLMQSVADSVRIRYFNATGPNTFTEIAGGPAIAASGTFYVVLQDGNGNIPANGAALAVSGDGYKIFSDAGPVRNSVGELDLTGALGLPSYGAFYRVSYVAEATPVSIEVSATSGNLTVKNLLN